MDDIRVGTIPIMMLVTTRTMILTNIVGNIGLNIERTGGTTRIDTISRACRQTGICMKDGIGLRRRIGAVIAQIGTTIIERTITLPRATTMTTTIPAIGITVR